MFFILNYAKQYGDKLSLPHKSIVYWNNLPLCFFHTLSSPITSQACGILESITLQEHESNRHFLDITKMFPNMHEFN